MYLALVSKFCKKKFLTLTFPLSGLTLKQEWFALRDTAV